MGSIVNRVSEMAENNEESEDVQEQDEILTCPTCGSMRIRETPEGELVCQQCGTVLDEERVAESSERRAFTAEEKERIERTGSPVTYTRPGRGMKTEIGRGAIREVSPDKRGQYYRMRKWQQRIDDSMQRRMKFALGEIERLVAVMNLPESIREEASRLYEKALEEGIVKGRNIENIVASLVYIVARNQGVPRTLSELSEETGVSERDLGKTYRYVARELDLRIIPVDPGDFLPRFASELGVSGTVQARARELMQEAREEGILSGRSPDSIVAAALYTACLVEGKEVTQKEISEVVGVTEVTVRKGYQTIVEGLGLEDQIPE